IDGISRSAPINPDGSFSIAFPTASLAVAAHAITYSYAGDSNFANASVQALMDVTYGILVLTNLSQAKSAGSKIGIQIELVNAGGQDVSAATIAVTALGIASTSTPQDLMPVQTAGNSNPGGLFQWVNKAQSYYQLDLKTAKDLGAGTYLLYFSVQG